jgi:D-alanyl-D-alanine carboxypeptidase
MMEQVLNKALAKASTQVTRKPMLIARTPQPSPARRPAPAPSAAAPSPSPAVAQASATDAGNGITMAKVRRVLIGSDTKRAQVAANDAGPPAGQPPSTLQAQAQALSNAPPARQPPAAAITTGANAEPRAEGKQRVAAREARGAFEIQIGAFNDAAEAERNMATARQRAGGVLDSYSAVAEPAQKGPGQIYRARFKGFDATAAASACGQLKKLQIDCFVVKAD